MKRIAVLVGVALMAIVLVPEAAMAKGMRSATIEGPQLAQPIRLDGDANSANRLAEVSGIYETMWGDAGEDTRPSNRLGPRYVVTFDLLVGQDETAPIRQQLYPLAEGGAVTYTRPGQRIRGRDKSVGGWYHAGDQLTRYLITLGVPPGSWRPVPVEAPPQTAG